MKKITLILVALCAMALFAGIALANEDPSSDLELGSNPFYDGVLMDISDELATRSIGDDIFIDPRVVPGVNFFGSSSWDDFLANGMTSLTADLGDIGDRDTDPTAYHILDEGRFSPGDMMVTSFNSWRGYANPDPPFENELGNRLHCSVRMIGDGTIQFSLDDILYWIVSSDHVLDFHGTLAGTTINNTTRFGYSYGPDRIKGTPDDFWLPAGSDDTALMDEFFYIGVGNAYWPGAGDDMAGQAELNETKQYIYEEEIVFNCGYQVLGNRGEATLLPDIPIFADGFESGDTSAWDPEEEAP